MMHLRCTPPVTGTYIPEQFSAGQARKTINVSLRSIATIRTAEKRRLLRIDTARYYRASSSYRVILPCFIDCIPVAGAFVAVPCAPTRRWVVRLWNSAISNPRAALTCEAYEEREFLGNVAIWRKESTWRSDGCAFSVLMRVASSQEFQRLCKRFCFMLFTLCGLRSLRSDSLCRFKRDFVRKKGRFVRLKGASFNVGLSKSEVSSRAEDPRNRESPGRVIGAALKSPKSLIGSENPWRKRLMLISHRALCNIDDGQTSERRHLLSRRSSSWPHPSLFQCATHVGGNMFASVRTHCVNSCRCTDTCARARARTLVARIHAHVGARAVLARVYFFRGPASPPSPSPPSARTSYRITFHAVLTEVPKLRCDDLAVPLKGCPATPTSRRFS